MTVPATASYPGIPYGEPSFPRVSTRTGSPPSMNPFAGDGAEGGAGSGQHVTTCGSCRKCRSEVHRAKSCWTTRDAIQRSFVGMGEPRPRSWRWSWA